MLVLSRQRDESIIIGDNIVVTIVDIRGDKVRLGIEAPAEIFVDSLIVKVTLDRSNVVIRYTLDSKPPTDESPAVEGPVVLTSTVALTAQAYRNGHPVSPTVART